MPQQGSCWNETNHNWFFFHENWGHTKFEVWADIRPRNSPHRLMKACLHKGNITTIGLVQKVYGEFEIISWRMFFHFYDKKKTVKYISFSRVSCLITSMFLAIIQERMWTTLGTLTFNQNLPQLWLQSQLIWFQQPVTLFAHDKWEWVFINLWKE